MDKLISKISENLKFNFSKERIKIIVISICVFLGLFAIDWLLKGIVFNNEKEGIVVADWKIIGFRSYAHYNTTVLSALKWKLPLGVNIVIDWLILIGFLFLPYLFTRKKEFLIATAVISAGVLGNALDRMVFEYVRDILFTPWMDGGTFNFADVVLVGGAILYAFFSLFDLFKEFQQNNPEDQTQVIKLKEEDKDNVDTGNNDVELKEDFSSEEIDKSINDKDMKID